MNRKEYHEDWTDKIRPEILKRDNYKCRHCGQAHKVRVYKNSRRKYVECDEFVERWAKAQGHKVFTLYLQVAHLDQDKTNNDPSNLLSLCPRCHGKYDKESKRFKRLLYKEKVKSEIVETSIVYDALKLVKDLHKYFNIDQCDKSKEVKNIQDRVNKVLEKYESSLKHFKL